MAYCIVIHLPKGGVIKTTVAVNISAGFARAGWRVLLIDCDAQGNASQHVGWRADGRPTLTNVLLDEPRGLSPVEVRDAIRSTYVERLDLVPASDGLGPADLILGSLPGWERRLKLALEPVRNDYDVIVLDTPPGLSTIVTNACVAADGLLIPVSGEAESLEGMHRLLAKLEEWRHFTRAPMPILGVVRGRWDVRRRLERETQAQLLEIPAVADSLLEAVIPDQTVVARAYRATQDVAAYAPTSDAARAFTALVGELAERILATPGRASSVVGAA